MSRALLLGLVVVTACRRDPAPVASAPLPASLAASDAVQFAFEADLEGWAAIDDGARFVFRAQPRFKKDGAVATHLRLGETLALVDKHLHFTLTLRRVSEDELGFDFTWRHRPPVGALETASGQLVFTRAFSARWRACSSDAECVVIPTYCGGFDAVSRRGEPSAAAFYERISRTKDCLVKKLEPPGATCVEGMCRPSASPR